MTAPDENVSENRLEYNDNRKQLWKYGKIGKAELWQLWIHMRTFMSRLKATSFNVLQQKGEPLVPLWNRTISAFWEERYQNTKLHIPCSIDIDCRACWNCDTFINACAVAPIYPLNKWKHNGIPCDTKQQKPFTRNFRGFIVVSDVSLSFQGHSFWQRGKSKRSHGWMFHISGSVNSNVKKKKKKSHSDNILIWIVSSQKWPTYTSRGLEDALQSNHFQTLVIKPFLSKIWQVHLLMICSEDHRNTNLHSRFIFSCRMYLHVDIQLHL